MQKEINSMHYLHGRAPIRVPAFEQGYTSHQVICPTEKLIPEFPSPGDADLPFP